MSIIGIDLGTTNSAVSTWSNGQPELIKNVLGEYLTPSVVSIDEQGNILVGQAAKERLITSPSHTVEQFKRYMGTKKSINLGKKNFSAIELSSLVLKSLKEDAEAHLNSPVEKAVISVPAYFNDLQRQATKVAAELAGLTVEKLINEPTAAALSYGVHESPDDKTYIILDLGGGTFDVTLLEYFDGVMEVHASSGDNFLGGMDFLETIVNDFLKQHDIEKSNLSSHALSSLYQSCEQLKLELTHRKSASFEIILDEQQFSYALDEGQFEAKCEPILKKLIQPIERVINDSNISSLDDISDVILVGGATRMPIFHKLISKLLRRIPSYRLNPDLVVAKGAAVQAALSADDQALEDIVLTDVSPFSLGVAVLSSTATDQCFFDPIISRNTILPVSISHEYYNAHDDQTGLVFQVYQGESKFLENNLHIGDIEIEIPKSAKNETAVDVRFSYDTNGLLEVDTLVQSTQKAANVVFEQTAGKLSESDKQLALEKLAKLKYHPRDNIQNITLLEALDRLYMQCPESNKAMISQLIEHFIVLIDSQNIQEIQNFRKHIKSVIEEFDSKGLLHE